MKTSTRFAACLSLLILAGCAGSSPEVRDLAGKTSANVGIISVQLARLQRNSSEVAERRADNIARLHGANARLRAQYEIEVELRKRSGGGSDLALVDKLKAWRKKVDTILAKAADAETARKKQILATQASLDTRAKALAEIAQGLAELAKKETAKDRAKFLKGYAKDLKKEMDEALKADTKNAKAVNELLDDAKKRLGVGS